MSTESQANKMPQRRSAEYVCYCVENKLSVKRIETNYDLPLLGFKGKIPVVASLKENHEAPSKNSASTSVPKTQPHSNHPTPGRKVMLRTDHTSGKKFLVVHGQNIEVTEVSDKKLESAKVAKKQPTEYKKVVLGNKGIYLKLLPKIMPVGGQDALKKVSNTTTNKINLDADKNISSTTAGCLQSRGDSAVGMLQTPVINNLKVATGQGITPIVKPALLVNNSKENHTVEGLTQCVSTSTTHSKGIVQAQGTFLEVVKANTVLVSTKPNILRKPVASVKRENEKRTTMCDVQTSTDGLRLTSDACVQTECETPEAIQYTSCTVQTSTPNVAESSPARCSENSQLYLFDDAEYSMDPITGKNISLGCGPKFPGISYNSYPSPKACSLRSTSACGNNEMEKTYSQRDILKIQLFKDLKECNLFDASGNM